MDGQQLYWLAKPQILYSISDLFDPFLWTSDATFDSHLAFGARTYVRKLNPK